MGIHKDEYKEDREFARKWMAKKRKEMKKKNKGKTKSSKKGNVTVRKKIESKSVEENVEKEYVAKTTSKSMSNDESNISKYMRDYNEETDGWTEIQEYSNEKLDKNDITKKEWKSFKIRLLILFLSGLVAAGVYTYKEMQKFMDTVEEVRVQREEKKEEPNINYAKSYFFKNMDQEYLEKISGIKETDSEDEKIKKMQETYDSLSDEFKLYIRNPEKVREIEEKSNSDGNTKNNKSNYSDTERD